MGKVGRVSDKCSRPDTEEGNLRPPQRAGARSTRNPSPPCWLHERSHVAHRPCPALAGRQRHQHVGQGRARTELRQQAVRPKRPPRIHRTRPDDAVQRALAARQRELSRGVGRFDG
jgi:hypothetical protein